MFILSNFLEKFKKIDSGRKAWVQEIIDATNTHSKVILKPEEISVAENGMVRITCSPIRRGEVFMFKDKIVKDLLYKGVKITDFV